MKYCENCGTKLKEDDKFCPNCGTKINIEESVITRNDKIQTNSPQSKTDGLALAGFILSLTSILCCGLTSMPGLIFSIIGLIRAKKENKEGKGLAIAGIVISSIMLLFLILIYIFVYVFETIDKSPSSFLPIY